MEKKIVVIGGGPAGMMAAISAASHGSHRVTLVEKNERLGQKLLMTGKGRCNFTNVRPIGEFIDDFGPGGRFLHGALSRFSQLDLIRFFEKRGVATKIERGKRVFPVSDQATTILKALEAELKRKKVSGLYSSSGNLVQSGRECLLVKFKSASPVSAQAVIVTTGGASYPETGSTGDGYQWAKSFGHTILPLKPSLASLFVKDERVRSLAGLTLKNVSLSVWQDEKKKAQSRGELLFTHQGVTGPIPFALCTQVFDLTQKRPVLAKLDLKPALKGPKLKKSLYRRIHQNAKKEFRSLLNLVLPASMVELALNETAISPKQQNSLLTCQEVDCLANFIASFSFFIEHTSPLSKAIVTSGGVDYRQISPQTMESKLVPGLYFAGEIIGLAGPSGGYNL
ncbi:NAD(P)/FAD-dependent oxidoreductase, partial [Patescibacteria group bacterium]|nr:NAD(P)/FAD-dependent oxidoreductase [Patescibacteria group bacterium]